MSAPIPSAHDTLAQCKALFLLLAEKLAMLEAALGPGAPSLPGETTDWLRSVVEHFGETTDAIRSVVSRSVETTERGESVASPDAETTDSVQPVASPATSLPEPLPGAEALRRVLARREARLPFHNGAQAMARILLRLCTHPHSNGARLAAMLGITSSGISKNLASLVRRGLLVRTGHTRHALTPKAVEYLHAAAAAG